MFNFFNSIFNSNKKSNNVIFNNSIKNWKAIDDQSSRGGNSTMSFSTPNNSNDVLFKASLVPIKGESGPVGFSLARIKLNSSNQLEHEVFHIKFIAESAFTISLAFIDFKGRKFQFDKPLIKGVNELSLKAKDFVLSKWGKTYDEKLSSFKNVKYFEHGVLFSRQGQKEYVNLVFKWSLSLI